jgi:ankyrin repeat protein
MGEHAMLFVNRISMVFSPLVILVASASLALSQNQTPDAQPHGNDIPPLIEKLRDIAEGDIGYMPNATGSGFLPLGKSEAGAMLLGSTDPGATAFQKPAGGSDAMRELVKHGAAAVPHLIAHLDDKRTTKITITHEAMIGGMFFNDEYDYNSRTTKQGPAGVNREIGFGENHPNAHTVTVGDLCFVALGQIVNRGFNAVRYQPTMCIMVNSPTYSEALRKAIKNEWGTITADQHMASLERDFLQPDSEYRRAGACLRLGYYYPDALEPLVLKQLAEPRYNVFKVQTLVREKLYRARNAEERKKLMDDFVAKYGDVARQGILLYIWGDFELQEAAEEGRCSDASLKTKYPARACLMELFAYPKEVKSKGRPKVFPIENCTQARFIDTLARFPTAKIDQAILPIMRSTDENNLAVSCARYLVGRGADVEIRKSMERRLKDMDIERDEHTAEWFRSELKSVLGMQGWTPLHVAVHDGEPDHIKNLLVKGEEVNSRAANGQTPLHVAADCGNCVAVRLLLDRKANPNIKDEQGLTPVQLAVQGEYVPMVESLLGAGADVSDILVASFAGRADLVTAFLQGDKALVKKKTLEGNTALHLAALLGHVKVAESLVAHAADVNARNSSDITPLHCAVACSHADVVRLLLAHKADINAKNSDGQTPLDFAKERGNKDIIQLLEKKR